jgi:hypothetical protein
MTTSICFGKAVEPFTLRYRTRMALAGEFTAWAELQGCCHQLI